MKSGRRKWNETKTMPYGIMVEFAFQKLFLFHKFHEKYFDCMEVVLYLDVFSATLTSQRSLSDAQLKYFIYFVFIRYIVRNFRNSRKP